MFSYHSTLKYSTVFQGGGVKLKDKAFAKYANILEKQNLKIGNERLLSILYRINIDNGYFPNVKKDF